MSSEFKNIVHYFLLYRVVSRLSFYVPIFIVALLSLQLSFPEIGGVLFIYGISTAFFGNVFKGRIAKNSSSLNIVYGEVLKFLSNMVFAVLLFFKPEHYFIFLFCAQIAGGIGYCFSAVGDGCYLSKVIDKHHMPLQLQHFAQAKSSSYMFIAFLFAGIIGAILFQSVPYLPFLMTAVANMAAAMIAIKLLAKDVSQPDMPPILPVSDMVQNRGKAINLSFMVLSDIFLYAFLRSIVLALQLFVFPVLFFLEFGINVAFFGLLFGLYTISGFLGGRFYPYLLKFISRETSVGFLIVVTLLSMAATGLSNLFWVVIVAPVGIFFTAGMLRPAFLPALNSARDKFGNTINLVARAEQLFGTLSAFLYLVCGLALAFGYTSQRLIIAITGFIIVLLLVKTVFSLLSGLKKAEEEVKREHKQSCGREIENE